MSNAANTVSLNGRDCTLLPLNWKQLKERKEDIVTINGMKPNQGMFTEEQQDAIMRVIHASLSRSHQDIDETFVQTYLDLGNVTKMLQMVFGNAPAKSGDGAGEA